MCLIYWKITFCRKVKFSLKSNFNYKQKLSQSNFESLLHSPKLSVKIFFCIYTVELLTSGFELFVVLLKTFQFSNLFLTHCHVKELVKLKNVQTHDL